MLKHLYTVICERIVIDQNTNTISYLTCLEGVNVNETPAHIPLLALGTRWHNTSNHEEILEVSISIKTPSGKENELPSFPPVKTKSLNHRTNIVLDGFLVEEFGTYLFTIKMKIDGKWKVVSETPLVVNKILQDHLHANNIIKSSKKAK